MIRKLFKQWKAGILGLVLCTLVVFAGCQSCGTEPPVIPDTSTSSNKPAIEVDNQETTDSSDKPEVEADDQEVYDLDNDGISDIVEEQLIQRFAPVVKLHSEEQYLPANTPWYLERVRMRFNIDFRPDKQLLDMGDVNLNNLLSQEYNDQISGLTASSSDFFLEQTDANGDDDLDEYREDTREGTLPTGWACYAHVRLTPLNTQHGMYDIQYIFFYAYNGDMMAGVIETAHEADFEHITIRVEDDLETIHSIYYAAHDNEGKWYNMQSLPSAEDGYSLSETGQPVVYSAVNSHASYPWAGKWERNNLPDDMTDDEGYVWDCKQNVVNLGEKDYPLEDMQWIQYSGHWGEIGEMSWTTGPHGPAYQNWWNSD